MLYINSKASCIETLKFSKAHNTWATDKEFDHLHRLLTQKPAPKIVEAPVSNSNKQPTGNIFMSKTGVHSGSGPRTERKQEYNNDQRDPHQTIYRKKLADLLKKYPRVGFYDSLNKWNGNYTPKQASAIERAWADEFKDKPEPECDITEEEMNDPNWTPWD